MPAGRAHRCSLRGALGAALVAALCAPTARAGEPPALRIAALGTSLTARGGWDEALATRLEACLGRPVTVLNFGGSGRTSRWGRTQTAAVKAARPDLVTIEFSANDASVLKGFSIAESLENAEAIAQELRAGGADAPAILLMAMNPIHGPRRWIRPWLDHYYDGYAALAPRLGVGFLDLRPAWRAAGDLRAAIPDGAHPLPEIAAEVAAPPLAGAIAAMLGAEGCAAPAGLAARDGEY